jgi:hypothetical protein
MKRTIMTSFLFLLPINLCFMYGKWFQLNLLTIGMGLSVANHSHNFFTHDMIRKKVINRLDQIINSFNLFYPYYNALTSVNCFLYGTTNVFIISYIFLRYLLHTETENYTEKQKTLHALWHILFICSMSHCQWVCMYE